MDDVDDGDDVDGDDDEHKAPPCDDDGDRDDHDNADRQDIFVLVVCSGLVWSSERSDGGFPQS